MRSVLLTIGLTLAAWLCATPAVALEAVQERRYRPLSEITVGLGYLPLDPYTKGLSASLGYLTHLSSTAAVLLDIVQEIL